MSKTKPKPAPTPPLPRFILINDTVYHPGEVFTVIMQSHVFTATLFMYDPAGRNEYQKASVEFRGADWEGRRVDIHYQTAHQHLFVHFWDMGDRRRMAGLPTYYHYHAVVEGHTVRAVRLQRTSLTDAPFVAPITPQPGIMPGTQLALFS